MILGQKGKEAGIGNGKGEEEKLVYTLPKSFNSDAFWGGFDGKAEVWVIHWIPVAVLVDICVIHCERIGGLILLRNFHVI